MGEPAKEFTPDVIAESAGRKLADKVVGDFEASGAQRADLREMFSESEASEGLDELIEQTKGLVPEGKEVTKEQVLAKIGELKEQKLFRDMELPNLTKDLPTWKGILFQAALVVLIQELIS